MKEDGLLSPQQLVDVWLRSIGKKYCPDISTVRELGLYLTIQGDKKSFFILYANGDMPKPAFAGYTSSFSREIESFVAYKRSCGFKYIRAEYDLKHFDAFCASSENEHLSPQQLADKWILKKEDEHPNTRSGRVGPVRVFGKYLTDIGHSRAFSIADDIAPGAPPKPPYLFFEDDIDIFFAACAGLKPDGKDPYIHIVLPSAFLFMHCMGVRTCELIILMENVNFDTGEVIIVDAKNGDRVVHMSKELTGFLSKYNLMIEKIFPSREYLFPASVSRSRNDFAQYFRAIWMSSVPNEGHGTPRLYDFRHHFLYRNVELCMRSGGDVNVLRPYIMRHMGHKLPESFQYYFHLSPPIQKEISRIKNALDWMIPDIPEVPYE